MRGELLGGVFFLCIPLGANGAGFFTGLGGDLPGDGFLSQATGVSADGTAVSGSSLSAPGTQAFRWKVDSGLEGIGDLPGGSFYSLAIDISDDGRIIAGTSHSARGIEAFRWVEGVGMTGLGALPGTIFRSEAQAISGDGSAVVGWSLPYLYSSKAFRWTEGDGMLNLQDLPGGGIESFAFGASQDGSSVVGRSGGSKGPEAFLWRVGVGMVGLGDLPKIAGIRQNNSKANAISSDERFVVGWGTSAISFNGYPPLPLQAVRWVDGTPQGLGDLPGGDFFSEATGVSEDGAIVVGQASNDLGTTAFLWSDTSGMRELVAVLRSDFGLHLDGWHLFEARDLSAGGDVAVGNGINPDGLEEGWIAFLTPEGLPARIRVGEDEGIPHVVVGPGVIPMVLFGSPVLEIGDVDLRSLSLMGTRPVHDLSDAEVLEEHLADVDGDGITDLISHYDKTRILLERGEQRICLTGEALARGTFTGCAQVYVHVPRRCGLGFEVMPLLAVFLVGRRRCSSRWL